MVLILVERRRRRYPVPRLVRENLNARIRELEAENAQLRRSMTPGAGLKYYAAPGQADQGGFGGAVVPPAPAVVWQHWGQAGNLMCSCDICRGVRWV